MKSVHDVTYTGASDSPLGVIPTKAPIDVDADAIGFSPDATS